MEWDPEGRLCILRATIFWITWFGAMGVVAVVLLTRDAGDMYDGVNALDAEDAV